MKKPPSIIIGFGNVGRELVLLDEIWMLTDVVGILSSKGGIKIEGKETATIVRNAAKSQKKLNEIKSFIEGLNVKDFLDQLAERGVAFISLPPSYSTGEPNTSLVLELLRNGISVITADKTPLAISFPEIMKTSLENETFFGFRATVAAGTPFIDLARGLRGRQIQKIRGVLNATTNFIISHIESGLDWSNAIKLAKEEKLLEPDPSIDIEGLDAAAKLAILSNLFGKRIRLGEVQRISLLSIKETEIRNAILNGRRYKYIAEFNFENGKAIVSPQVLTLDDPLSKIRGNYNGILVELEGKEKIYLEGPAGPAWRTARVMLTDLMEFLNLP